MPGEGAAAMAAIGFAEPQEAPAKSSSMVDQDAGKIESEEKPQSVEATSGGNTSMD